MGDRTGHVKLHRRIMDSEIWGESPGVVKVGLTMVMLAEYRPVERRAPRGEMVSVPRGHVLASVRKVARDARVDRKYCAECLRRLADIEFALPTDVPNMYQLPTYDRWNPRKRVGARPANQNDEGGGQTGQPRGLDRPMGGGQTGQLSIYQEYKEPKNKGKEAEFSLSHPPDPKPKARRVKNADVKRVLQAHSYAVQQELGITPTHSQADREHARQLVLKLGADHATELAGAWPSVNNKGAREQAYPMRWLPSNIDAVELVLRGGAPSQRLRVCTDPNDPSWKDPI